MPFPADPRPAPPATPVRRPWRRDWPALPPRWRRQLATAAAHAVHTRLETGGGLDCALEDFVVEPEAGGWRAAPWPPAREKPRRTPAVECLGWLVRQADLWVDIATPREAAIFLAAFLRLSGAPRGARRHFAGKIRRLLALARRARARALAFRARRELRPLGQGRRGAIDWPDGPGLENLLATLEARLDQGAARRLKISAESEVLWIDWDRRPVVAKWYPADRLLDRLKDFFRPPRALRAWIAGRALRQLGVPCPAPLAVVLDARHQGCRGHWFIAEAIPDAITARRWIKPRLHLLPEAARREAARRLLDIFTRLERTGVVHGDTKAGNLLVRLDAAGLPAAHWWIDLEAVRFDRAPGPRLLERNLIQLNGSIGRKLPREDRLAFLADYARHRPWARDPALPERIERITRLRLQREARRECGS